MPTNANRQFLDFEKPIKDLVDEIENLRHRQEKTKIDFSSTIVQLEQSIVEKRKEITKHLSSWQRVQLSRHPDRPYTLKYIEHMTENFIELYGDRNVKDDKAMVGGFANLDGETVMLIGQQKGTTTCTFANDHTYHWYLQSNHFINISCNSFSLSSFLRLQPGISAGSIY